MSAFRLVEIDNRVVVILQDERLVAAFRALAYAWKENPESSRRVDFIVQGLSRAYELLTSCM